MDRREKILERLATVLAGIDGIKTVERNREDADEVELPAALLLDADEVVDEASFGRSRPAFGPDRVSMTPEIYLVLQAKRGEVGTRLNALRLRIIPAVKGDAELQALCQDGDIRYEGCFTPFARGRTFRGEMRVDFTFVYMVNPWETTQ